MRGGREVPCREFRPQGPWLRDEPLEVPPGLDGGPEVLFAQEKGAISSPGLDGGPTNSTSTSPLVFGVTTRGELPRTVTLPPPLHSLAKVDSMHDRGKGALRGVREQNPA